MPQFVQLQRDTSDGLNRIVKGVQASQATALQAVGRSLDGASRVLEVLSLLAQTDEVRLGSAKLSVEVRRQGIKVWRTVERMNKDNNAFWWWATGTAAVTVVGVALLVFTGGRGNVLKA
jgi:hypothetical protein